MHIIKKINWVRPFGINIEYYGDIETYS